MDAAFVTLPLPLPTCTYINLMVSVDVKHHSYYQTTNIDFRHLSPDAARIGYATEGALFISAQLSTDAVGALRKVWVLVIRLWKQHSVQV